MILTCPNCGTQYVVKDDAVPPQGRQVRCAACKHSWHQDPDQVAEADQAMATQPESEPLAEPQPIAEPEVAPEEEEPLGDFEPRSGPEIEERAYEESVIESGQPEAVAEDEISGAPAEEMAEPEAVTTDWQAPPAAEADEDDFTPFPADDELEPRQRRPLLGVLIVLLVIAAAAAAFWFLAPPEWKARVGLSAADASPLALVTTHMDRQKLESGNELLTVAGRVINPTSKDQDVPPLQAQLRTRAGQVVYSWTIAPPARTLPPGASASFNSAEVNVPPGGEELTISIGSPNA